MSSYCSAFGAETPLDQAAMLDANNAITPKSTSTATGTMYRLDSDITIMDAGQTAALASSCFVQTAADLTFLGNGHSLLIENVNTGANPGAINVSTADKSLTLSGFSSLIFRKCPPSTVANGKGSLVSKGPLNFRDNLSLIFSENSSSAAGGAISSKACLLTGSKEEISFTTNKSATKGGAIAATDDLTISDNLGIMKFSDNTAANSGGAIFAEAATSISGNNRVIFENNTVTGTGDGCGGAIHCSKTGTTPTLTLSNNKTLIFKENRSASQGGAIYSDKLVISSGGPTLFTGNKSVHATPKGGAIAIHTSGECSLTAEHGDIIFQGNTIETANAATVKRNAIHLGNNAKFVQLRATEGRAVRFYDPITAEGAAGDALVINKAEQGKAYKGTVLFSGEKLTETESAVAENLKFAFKQPLELAAGTLILSKGVNIEAKSFTQSAGSKLFMDAGTKIKADTENAVITDLAINPNSLDGVKLAVIEASAAGKSVTLSGTVTLEDPKGSYYENHKLDKALALPGLKLLGKNAVTTDNVTDKVAISPEQHYGYQGKWIVSWEKDNTADPKTATATFTWEKTGYNPNPERRASLVPNSLWGCFMDITSIQQLMEKSTDSYLHGRRSLWAANVSNFFHRDNAGSRRKFRHISSGYALGATTETSSEDIVSVSLCQLFTKDKDYNVAKNSANVYAGSILFQHIGESCSLANLISGKNPACLEENCRGIPVILDAQLTYCHSNNNMKTMYTDYPTVKGSWGNDSLGIQLGSSIPVTCNKTSLCDSYSPFMKMQLVYAHQGDFKEPTDEGREFSGSDLLNLSLPLGIKFERSNETEKASYDLTLMYVADIYRVNPRCLTSLVISDVSWQTHASNLARQAFVIQSGNHMTVSSRCEIFSQFGFELRSSSRNVHMNVGSKILF
ncbi:autotransporter beta-domain protein [Chlamydia ibidis]|uniref:Autotransporter beta-domain protein n=2 Tax=Chlamydia ibidis TaxID=1405396 RepID=S7J2W7_9CHLA|nr:autotransporter beta-domain protein [Chlamydia ibidis]EQM62854.1 autotransporter beta-domain protein [Chlamydia ibidis 10-1398/6]